MSKPGGPEPQRLDAARRWARARAHQANNLMTLVVGNADLLSSRSGENLEEAAFLRDLADAVGKLDVSLRDTFAELGYPTSTRESRPWVEAVESALKEFGAPLENGGVPPGARASLAIDDFRAMVKALVRNALEAAPDDSPRVSAWVEGEAPGKAILAIENRLLEDGASWPGAVAFEPFYSSKEGHLGLGLALAHGVAKAHQAELTVDATDATKVVFRVALPLE